MTEEEIKAINDDYEDLIGEQFSEKAAAYLIFGFVIMAILGIFAIKVFHMIFTFLLSLV